MIGKYQRPDGSLPRKAPRIAMVNTATPSVAGTEQEPPLTAPSTPEAQLWDGWGTALKPAFEPIVAAMKPIDGTYVNNALTWGVAGLWIDGGRVEASDSVPLFSKDNQRQGTSFMVGSKRTGETTMQGRFPANFIHDGSDEVVGLFPQTTGGGANGKRQLGPYSDNRTWSVSKTPGAETQNGLPASSICTTMSCNIYISNLSLWFRIIGISTTWLYS